MKRNYTKKITYTALYAAVICLATMFLKFNFAYGYINLGDVFIIAGCFLLSFYCIPAAGIGSFLADILTGWVEYALPTLIIKSIMALAIVLVLGRKYNIYKILTAAVLSEIIMIFGYSLYRYFVYGFVLAIGQVPTEMIQAGAAIVIAPIIIILLSKNSFTKKLRNDFNNLYKDQEI